MEDMWLVYVVVIWVVYCCYMGVVLLINNERSVLVWVFGVGGDGSNNDWLSVLNCVVEEEVFYVCYIDGDEFEEVYIGFE